MDIFKSLDVYSLGNMANSTRQQGIMMDMHLTVVCVIITYMFNMLSLHRQKLMANFGLTKIYC